MNLNEYLEDMSNNELYIKKLNEKKSKIFENNYTPEECEIKISEVNKIIEEKYKKLSRDRKIVNAYSIINSLSNIKYNSEEELKKQIKYKEIELYSEIYTLDDEIEQQLLNDFNKEADKISNLKVSKTDSFDLVDTERLKVINTSKIDSLLPEFSSIFVEYNNIINELLKLDNKIHKINYELYINNKLDDEKINIWYERDIPINTRNLISYDEYKSGINNFKLSKINKKKSELLIKINEYYANLYYLLQMKNDIFIKLNNKKNTIKDKNDKEQDGLNNLMKNLQVLSFDSNKSINSYNQMDELLKSIAEDGYLLYIINEYLNLISFTKKEISIAYNGLNIDQKNLYDKIEKKYNPEFEFDFTYIKPVDEKEDNSDTDSDKKVNNISNTSLNYKFLNENKEVVNIEIPNIKLKSSVYDLKKYLKSEKGTEDIYLLLTNIENTKSGDNNI